MAAAGIGEASAIIAVAEFGIKVARGIATFVADVKEAETRLRGLSADVLRTAYALEVIGNLVRDNVRNRLISDAGLQHSQDLTTQIQGVLENIQVVLISGGIVKDPNNLSNDLTQPTLSFRLKWAGYLRSHLDVPRKELAALKIDLVLLELSVRNEKA